MRLWYEGLERSVTFKMRKLCSSTEEYEASECGPMDLVLFAVQLSQRPRVELSRYETTLTLLFEEESVVVRLFSNGKTLIQAWLREEAKRVCSNLTVVSNCIASKDKD
jgi:hypothetical protein